MYLLKKGNNVTQCDECGDVVNIAHSCEHALDTGRLRSRENERGPLVGMLRHSYIGWDGGKYPMLLLEPVS